VPIDKMNELRRATDEPGAVPPLPKKFRLGGGTTTEATEEHGGGRVTTDYLEP